jgi:hypothetical protein
MRALDKGPLGALDQITGCMVAHGLKRECVQIETQRKRIPRTIGEPPWMAYT